MSLLRTVPALVGLVAVTVGPKSPAIQTARLVVGKPIRVTEGSEPHVEPVIAADPADARRLVAAAVAITERGFTGWEVRTFTSGDGGASWIPSTQADEPMCNGDPWIEWSAWGTVYLSCLSEFRDSAGRDRLATRVFRSDDGGRTWSTPVLIPQPERGSFDHPVIRAGADGLVVVVATLGLSSIAVNRSFDGGLTFSAATLYTPDSLNNNLGSALVHPDSGVSFTYYTMSRVPQRRLWAVSAVGERLGERVLVTAHHEPWGFNMLAADESGGPFDGRVYASWITTNGAGGRDIFVSHRVHRDADWSAGEPIHRDTGTLAVRWMPNLTVNRNGVLALAWRDARGDPGGKCFATYITGSVDGGQTFLRDIPISEPSCADVAGSQLVGERWPAGGDYLGIDSAADGGFHVIWSDTGSGSFQVWSARVTAVRQ